MSEQSTQQPRPANWLAEQAELARRRLQAMPPEMRSSATRALIGPDLVPCPSCGGKGTRLVFRHDDPFRPERTAEVEPHSAEYVAALEEECAKANELIGLLRLAVQQHTVADSNFDRYLQYRQLRDQRMQAEQAERAVTGRRP